jgi:hypothetical protein
LRRSSAFRDGLAAEADLRADRQAKLDGRA